MTREERIDWLCRLKADLNNGVIFTPWNKEFTEALTGILEQEPEPVYFPPCVDCQNRSKEILTAYNNMKKMQTYTKEEVITMLDKIRTEIGKSKTEHEMQLSENDIKAKLLVSHIYNDIVNIFDKYKAESEG